MSNILVKKEVSTFLILLLIIAIYPYYAIIKNGMEKSGSAVFLLMWAPGIAGIICSIIFKESLGLKFNSLNNALYGAFAYILPILGGVVVYNIVWLTGLGTKTGDVFKFNDFKGALLFLFGGVALASITALGEELGWRGYLTPIILKDASILKTSLFMGILWSLYHYPVLILSDYNSGNIYTSILFFTISIFAVTLIATILREVTGSMWPSLILHATHNYFIQGVFDKVTKDNGNTKFFTTEFGVGLAIFYSISAILFYLYHIKSNNS